MEKAIETLIKNFHQYSVEGGKETLTPSELRDLVTQQLPHLMPVLREWVLSQPPSVPCALRPCTYRPWCCPALPLASARQAEVLCQPLGRVGWEGLKVLPD